MKTKYMDVTDFFKDAITRFCEAEGVVFQYSGEEIKLPKETLYDELVTLFLYRWTIVEPSWHSMLRFTRTENAKDFVKVRANFLIPINGKREEEVSEIIRSSPWLLAVTRDILTDLNKMIHVQYENDDRKIIEMEGLYEEIIFYFHYHPEYVWPALTVMSNPFDDIELSAYVKVLKVGEANKFIVFHFNFADQDFKVMNVEKRELSSLENSIHGNDLLAVLEESVWGDFLDQIPDCIIKDLYKIRKRNKEQNGADNEENMEEKKVSQNTELFNFKNGEMNFNPEVLHEIMSRVAGTGNNKAMIEAAKTLVSMFDAASSLADEFKAMALVKDAGKNSDLKFNRDLFHEALMKEIRSEEKAKLSAPAKALLNMFETWNGVSGNEGLLTKEGSFKENNKVKLSKMLDFMALIHQKEPEMFGLGKKEAEKALKEKATPTVGLKVLNKIRGFKDKEQYRILTTGVELRKNEVDPFMWQNEMDRMFPWMAPLTDRLVRRMLIATSKRLPFQLPNLGLVGDPGVGKTLYWKKAMELLEYPFLLVNLAGSNDSTLIKGTPAGWSTEKPGLAAQAMAFRKCANPVIILDELDKCGGSDRNGRADEALLPLLEPTSASMYYDECLQEPLNTSKITWIATLNDEMKLNASIRNRLEIVEVRGPNWDDYTHVSAAIEMAVAEAKVKWAGDANACLTETQKKTLMRTNWKSLRSLSKKVDEMIEQNLFSQAMDTYQEAGKAEIRATTSTAEERETMFPSNEQE